MLDDGRPVLYLERGGRSLVTFRAFDDEETAARAIAALGTIVTDGRVRTLQVERVDGAPVVSSPLRTRLDALGFRPAYRGLVLRAAEPSTRRGRG